MSEEKPEKATDTPKREDLIAMTSDIVAAYVAKNPVASNELPGFIETVYNSMSKAVAPAAPEADQKPAVPIKRSVRDDAIVCLECGKAQKTLKRHLTAAHDTTPEEYRAKWRLPPDYPMVAPSYAEKRRSLAKQIGLGRKSAATKKSAPKRKTNNRKKG